MATFVEGATRCISRAASIPFITGIFTSRSTASDDFVREAGQRGRVAHAHFSMDSLPLFCAFAIIWNSSRLKSSAVGISRPSVRRILACGFALAELEAIARSHARIQAL